LGLEAPEIVQVLVRPCRNCSPLPALAPSATRATEVRRAADLLERRWTVSILSAALREEVFDVGRAGVDHLPPEYAGLLEVGEPLGEGRRRDAAERLQELVEADGNHW
jgi:hypothetical protein